jgi:hypothetical protein
MNSKDKILKSVWNCVEAFKDSTQRDVMKLVASKTLKLQDNEVKLLLAVINSSIESTFHKSSKTLEREISDVINSSNVVQEKPAKKK